MKMTQTRELNVDTGILHQCVKKELRKEELTIIDWQVSPFSIKKKNFTTGGLYRIHGLARSGKNDYPWSLFLKIIQPESEEKKNPVHFNYWKREALVFSTGLLNHIPTAIRIPRCYAVEEKSDSEVWLWMEEVKESNSGNLSLEEFSFIASQIGLWHGEYATGKYPLPNGDWICQNWLESWIDGCDQYGPNPYVHYPKIKGLHEIVDSLWASYLNLRQHQKQYLQALNRIPRVLSHHDLSHQNMFTTYTKDNPELIIIDWQYVSISGLGEDLGKLFGVALSQGNIPVEEAWDYQKHLFDSYIEGLRKAGWNGNPLLPRLGFCLSVAYRSAWEMPKLIKMHASNSETNLKEGIEKYSQIVQVQMRFAEEAKSILEKI